MANQNEISNLRSNYTELVDKMKNSEVAEHFVNQQVTKKVEEGSIIELTEDEERLLRSYRSFKKKNKDGSVFKWRTPETEGIVLVESESETNLIVDPREVV